jgi:hypothetical protein
MFKRSVALGFVFLVCACAPNVKAPVSVMALVLSTDGTYGPQQVQLQTVTDIVGLNGPTLNMIGGARIVVDPNDPLLSRLGPNPTNQQLAQVYLKDPGRDVSASYLEKGGVLWPMDFDSWNMATTYYNFEKASEYFQSIGDTPDELNGAKVYYFPYYAEVDISNLPIEDNAIYNSLVQGFLILPFQQLQAVPLAMNLGIIGHEFSHRVFNTRVYQGQSIPAPFLLWGNTTPVQILNTPSLNILKSLDEGLADWHGVGATCLSPSGCNPRFLEASLGSDAANARDMSRLHCLTPSLFNALHGDDVNTFISISGQYEVGTIIASALYQAAGSSNLAALQQAVLKSYIDSDPNALSLEQLIPSNLNTPQNFTLEAVVDTLASHIDDAQLRTAVCTRLADRLSLDTTQLHVCTGLDLSQRECPQVP